MKPTIAPVLSPNRLPEKRNAQGRHFRPSEGPGYAHMFLRPNFRDHVAQMQALA